MIHTLMALLLGLGIPALLAVLWAMQARENRRAILRRILGRVDGRLVSNALTDEVVGTQDGRAFHLRLGTRKKLSPIGPRGEAFPDVYPIVVELALAHAPPVRLRVRRDAGLARVEKALGLVQDVEVAGGAGFDEAFVVEADDQPVALSAVEVRKAIEELLGRWSLDEVVVADGKLVARGAPELVGQKQLQGLLNALEVLAHAFDRRPALEIGVKSPGGFAWIGGAGSSARCPFCHDGLEGGELVECERCHTLMHGDCHGENGGCPILGCGARGADRAGPDPKREAGGLDLA